MHRPYQKNNDESASCDWIPGFLLAMDHYISRITIDLIQNSILIGYNHNT